MTNKTKYSKPAAAAITIAVLAFNSSYLYSNYHYLQRIRPDILIRQLDYQRPEFDHFISILKNNDVQDKNDLKKYVTYYHFLLNKLKYPEAGVVLGYLYFRLGQEDQAISVLEQAKMLDQDFFWTNYNLGIFYFRQHEFEAAAENMAAALAVTIEEAVSKMLLSRVYVQILNPILGDYPAVTLVNHILKARENSILMMTASLYASGQYEKAVGIISLCLKENISDNPDLFFWQGHSLLALDRYQEALSSFLMIKEDDKKEEIEGLIKVCVRNIHDQGSAIPESAIESPRFKNLKKTPIAFY